MEGAEHLGRGEAGGGRGPQPGGPAQLHTSGPRPAAAGGEKPGEVAGMGREAGMRGDRGPVDDAVCCVVIWRTFSPIQDPNWCLESRVVKIFFLLRIIK